LPVIVVDPELQVATWQTKPALHTQTFPLHVVPDGHGSLQVIEPPQLSPRTPPQYCPPLAGLQVSGAQLASPLHTPETHVLPAPQSVLHESECPQPSPTTPQ
jgi:hypothetical protein